MRDFLRSAGTGCLWVAFTLASLALFWMAAAGSSSATPLFILVALAISGVLGLAGVAATLRIWQGSRAESLRPPQMSQSTGKLKRDAVARLAHLVERLDEDEVIELESLLQARGEDVI